jgi:Co/Zn/Cd efflux system component
MDPLVGIIGAVLVMRWSLRLLVSTSSVLLDKQASPRLRQTITDVIEQDGDSRVSDLHVWSIGPDILSAQVSLVAHHPATPEHYKQRIAERVHLDHVTVEIHVCRD